ncbi:MAG: PilT/PilU family type 4a pilus ATPase [Polyangiales bacterium]
MPGLEKFLHYLDRADVSEIVFQSGATAAAKRKGRLQPVTREPLTAQHILKLVHSTPLQALVPEQDGACAPVATQINGSKYVATMARSGSMLLLRLWLPDSLSQPPANQVEPVGVPIGGIRTTAQRRAVSPIEVSVPKSPGTARTRAVQEFDDEEGGSRSAASLRPPPVAVQYPDARRVVARNSYHPPPEASPLAQFEPAGASIKESVELQRLLQDARSQAASDVHVMAGEPVRFRCNGYLVPQGTPLTASQVKTLLMPLFDERTEQQFEELGYADFACEVEGAGRLRVNTSKQRTGMKGCFRLIKNEPPTLESLGLPTELRQLLDYHQGLVVVSGPSGAGKTTTLAALVDLFNSARAVHIITVEDPVEIVHPIKRAIVSQRQIGAHTKSFQSALKGSLREDPDVIAIGELRDRETVEKALEAAETGHLVFATMSTPSGATTIDRLIDMFPPDDQSQVRATLAGALKFVVSQRLIPRADKTGSVAGVELLTGNMALWSLIRDDKLFQLPSLLQRGRGFGMIRIEDSLNQLLASGAITEKVARQYADDARLIGAQSASPNVQTSPNDRGSSPKGGRRNLFSRKDK